MTGKAKKVKILLKPDTVICGRYLLYPHPCWYVAAEVDKKGKKTGEYYFVNFIMEHHQIERVLKLCPVDCRANGSMSEKDVRGKKSLPWPKFLLGQEFKLMGEKFIVVKCRYRNRQWSYALGFLDVWLGKKHHCDTTYPLEELSEKNLESLVDAFRER